MIRVNGYDIAPTAADSVGEWQGREQEAADKFTALCVAIAEASTPRHPHVDLHAALEFAWDVWGSDAELPDLTPERIAQIAPRYAVRYNPPD